MEISLLPVGEYNADEVSPRSGVPFALGLVHIVVLERIGLL